MKNVIFISVCCCFLFVSCKTTQSSITSVASEVSADLKNDGSSIEKAIMAKSISSEYEWIRKNYPNSQVLQQALISKGSKHYDKLTVKLEDGSTRDFYFDINSFY